MLSNLCRASTRQPAARSKLLAAATPQRSLHTPIGNTRQKDEGYEVRDKTLEHTQTLPSFLKLEKPKQTGGARSGIEF